jgi:serine/threonine-protein kinase
LRARQVLEGAGLGYEEAVGMHGSAPEGTVVAQEPLPGQRTQPGSTVRVTLSLGPRTRSVPDVIGLGHEQATVVLGQSGYDSELVRVDAEADVGTVVATEPDPGTPLEVPGRVRVRVSAGPPRVRVPDLTALSLPDAQATLERLGLRAGAIRWTAADSLAPNSVVGQAPQAGVEVEREAEIDLVVARLQADTSVTPGDSLISPPDTARSEVDTIGPRIRDRRDGAKDGGIGDGSDEHF